MDRRYEGEPNIRRPDAVMQAAGIEDVALGRAAMSEIETVLGEIAKQRARLRERLMALRERLDPVFVETPGLETNERQRVEPRSKLGRSLDDVRADLCAAGDDVEEMLNRIAL